MNTIQFSAAVSLLSPSTRETINALRQARNAHCPKYVATDSDGFFYGLFSTPNDTTEMIVGPEGEEVLVQVSRRVCRQERDGEILEAWAHYRMVENGKAVHQPQGITLVRKQL